MSKQKGSLLIELAVVLAMLTLIAVGTVHWMAQRAQEAKVDGLAVWMQGVQQGLQAFLDVHAQALQHDASFTLAGIESMNQPTLAELKGLGFLSPSFIVKKGVEMTLYREGDCPSSQCHVHGLVYSSEPLLNHKKQVDHHAMAQWQTQVKGTGLLILERDPTRFVGAKLRLSQDQLSTSTPFSPGTVALLASTDATLVTRGGLQSDQNPSFTTDVDIDGNLTVNGDLWLERYLLLPHTETFGASCGLNGAVTRGSDGKGLMSCEGNKWVRPTAELDLLDAYREILGLYWKVSVPESAGGFYIESYHNSTFHCWAPNPLNLYHDGRGRCACSSSFKRKLVRVEQKVNERYFENGIERPELTVYVCV